MPDVERLSSVIPAPHTRDETTHRHIQLRLFVTWYGQLQILNMVLDVRELPAKTHHRGCPEGEVMVHKNAKFTMMRLGLATPNGGPRISR